MPCTKLGPSVIVCSRRRRRPSCSVAGCTNRSARQCDFPLTGPKAGKTCDRHLCASCSVVVGRTAKGDTIDYCPAHAEQTRKTRPDQP
jgi:hypothetical protein